MVNSSEEDLKGRLQGDGSGVKHPRVIIVGAGVAGIALATRLKKKLNFHNFTIFEKASSVGGTWRDNTYPGCGCDVPAHFYSLSTDLNPNWNERFPTQPDLYAYWQDLWRKYHLESHTRLNSKVVFSKWVNDRQLYQVDVVEQVEGGEERKETVEAEVLIYSVGGFQDVKYPTGLGDLGRFKGTMFHSAQWRHDVDLRGKKVAVIGNGCSAAQFVPYITADPSVEVINFARTPQWYVNQGNHTYPSWMKWIFAHVPGVMRAYRNWLMFRSDVVYFLFNKNHTFLVETTKKVLTASMKAKTPEKYHDVIIPSYPAGCKRMILDPGYLDSLHRPNMTLTFDPIDSIVEEGIKLKSGEVIPFDVIIFGTGYSLEALEVNVVGSQGTTVRDYFRAKGAPMAYIGTCYPGFPNMYTTLGPNVAVGHASVIFCHEAQIDYILQLVKPILDGTAKSFEVTEEATDEYNAWLGKRLENSVWTECTSFYNEVDGKKSRIFANFPGSITLFWWLCLSPQWSAFRSVGAEAWEKRRRLGQVKRWAMWSLFASIAVGVVSGFIRI